MTTLARRSRLLIADSSGNTAQVVYTEIRSAGTQALASVHVTGGIEAFLLNMPGALPLHTSTNLKDQGDLVYMAALFYSFIIWPLPTPTESELRAMLGKHCATHCFSGSGEVDD